MNINITLDIPAIVSNAVSAERIQPILDKAITEAISSAIREATGYNSEFRKAVEQQLAEAMPKGLHITEVAKFQHVLNAALTNAVQGENASTINAALAQAAKAVMPDVPERIKLSELMEKARGGLHKGPHESFYAYFDVSAYGGGTLYLDSDEHVGAGYGTSGLSLPGSRKYSAGTSLSISSSGSVYSLKLDSQQLSPSKLPKAIGSFQGLLLSMYVGRTSIEIDIDADDVEAAAQAIED